MHAQPRTPPDGIRVYLDGSCPCCTLAGKIVSALDRRGLVEITSYRTDHSYTRYGLSQEDVDRELCAVSTGETLLLYRGLDATIELCRRVRGLTILVPLLATLRAVGLGTKLYRLFADHRPRKKHS